MFSLSSATGVFIVPGTAAEGDIIRGFIASYMRDWQSPAINPFCSHSLLLI